MYRAHTTPTITNGFMLDDRNPPSKLPPIMRVIQGIVASLQCTVFVFLFTLSYSHFIKREEGVP